MSPPPTYSFTDDPLVAGTTTARAVHLTELRDAVNSARALWSLPAASWTDPTITPGGTTILAVHVSELRTALAAAYVAANATPPSYTDPTLTPAVTPVEAVHLNELRAAVRNLPAPSGGGTVYYHLDALGSVRAVTDANGSVIRRHDYLPFGEEYQPEAGADARRFTAKERDAETGLDYVGARFYGSQTGRFSAVDPALDQEKALLHPQRWNRYAYVRNNPIRFVDPDGRDTVPTQWQMTHGASGLERVLPAIGKALWNMVVSLNSPGHLSPEGEVHRQAQFMQPANSEEAAIMGLTDVAVLAAPLLARTANGAPAANPLAGLPRVGSALKTDPYHAFPAVVDSYASVATSTTLRPGVTLYQIGGSLNGVTGRFEWIVDKGKVTHGMFVPGGTLSGVAIKK